MRKKILYSLVFIFWGSRLLASYPEYFGTSHTTSAIGNQANWDANDASNIYYIPALSAFAKRPNIAAATNYIAPSINPINNIVTSNSTTGETGTTTVTGSANTDYGEALMGSFNFIIPILGEDMGALSIAYFSELGSIAESNSGDANLPEYVMLRARYKRTQVFLNYAYPVNDMWAFSVGAYLGFQAAASINTTISLSDTQTSSGAAKTKIDPSLAAVLSVARRDTYSIMYATFQQEMQSNFEATVDGAIYDPVELQINNSFSSVLYYDPHIFRVGYVNRFSFFDLYLSGEYQMWENFKSSKFNIRDNGGAIRSSVDYETLQLRNIFVPKIGVGFDIMPNTVLNLGLAYRQTPLEGEFSGAGNSVDTNSMILAGGLDYKFKLFEKDINLGFSAQYHRLEEKTVTKTSGQENGNAGSKIGAPGYTIGGNILAISTGFKIKF